MTAPTEANMTTLQEALNADGCERIKDFYNVGPAQRAAVESLVAALAQQDESAQVQYLKSELAHALAQHREQQPVCHGCGIPAGDVHMSTCKSGKWPSRVSNGDTGAPAPQAQDGRYIIAGSVWFRKSTNEWVLELSGSINDTSFVSRHTQPAETLPENVPSLSTLYAPAPQAQEPTAWRTEALKWIRRKAEDQRATNEQNPRHAEAYPSWGERVRQWHWLADELELEQNSTSFGLEPYQEPVPQPAQGEPVAWKVVTFNSKTTKSFLTKPEAMNYLMSNDADWDWYIEAVLAAALVQQDDSLQAKYLKSELAHTLAQQGQEPVAWAIYDKRGGSKSIHWAEQHTDGNAEMYNAVPLYKAAPAPQAQKPARNVTKEEDAILRGALLRSGTVIHPKPAPQPAQGGQHE